MQNHTGLRGLFPASYKEIQEHAEDGEQKDHENPQKLFDYIRVTLEAIQDRDDV
jgi:type II secretory pathway component PulC